MEFTATEKGLSNLTHRHGSRRLDSADFLNAATAQESPIHIWTKFFAGNSAARCLFDCRATLSRNRARAGTPLADQGRWNAQIGSQLFRASIGQRKVIGKVHGAHRSNVLIMSQ